MTTDQTEPSCSEFTSTSRRGLFRAAVGLGGAAAVSATFGSVFTQTAFAATPKAARVLVVLSMRGAADGLSLVVPHADPVYYSARPRISVPKATLWGADAMFGMHPSLKPLSGLWAQQKLAVVHAVGLPVANRSHFAAMEEVEDADPGSSARVGWLNRLVGRDTTASPIQAISYGGGVPSTHIYGPHPVLTTADVDSVKLPGPQDAAMARARRASMNTTWAKAPGALGASARSALRVIDEFAPVRAASPAPRNGASYPRGDLGKALSSAARTIRADIGAEVITVDHGSWDHHEWVGTVEDGNIKTMATEFASALAAFFTDLGALGDKVTVVTISEFGRRIVENNNWGLDHGHGGVMFLAGAGVVGGRYYGSWPGLAGNLDSDLPVTTDYRSVLAEVVSQRLGASSATVFPGFTPTRVGAVRAT